MNDYGTGVIHGAALALILSLGSLMGWRVLSIDYQGAVEPTTSELESDKIVGVTSAMTITLRFRDPRVIERETNPDAYAYARHNKNYCTITFPTGQAIEARPSDEYSAHWVDRHNNEAIAHELLHCLRGKWHIDE